MLYDRYVPNHQVDCTLCCNELIYCYVATRWIYDYKMSRFRIDDVAQTGKVRRSEVVQPYHAAASPLPLYFYLQDCTCDFPHSEQQGYFTWACRHLLYSSIITQPKFPCDILFQIFQLSKLLMPSQTLPMVGRGGLVIKTVYVSLTNNHQFGARSSSDGQRMHPKIWNSSLPRG